MGARTVSGIWHAAVAKPPPGAAFLVEEEAGWRPVAWSEAGRRVDELAAGFLSLGIGKGDRVAILSRTRLEWILCDWALISIGAPVVPIYPTSSSLECAYVLGNAGARILVCEDAAQLAKIGAVRSELDALEQVIAIEGDAEGALPLREVCARGRAYLEAHPDAIERARAELGEDDLLTIVYTSGTTGPPKGCILSHRNYWVMVDMIRRIGLVQPGDKTVLYLPLAHTFARLVEFLGPAVGLTIACCPDAAVVGVALRDVRPTIFPSVPRLYDKVRDALEAGFADATGARRRVIAWARRVGEQASAYRLRGVPCPRALALELRLADRLVFSKVKARLGGRLRVAISGGAPLSRETAEFFHALGILVLEGYGLTECTTVATVNRPSRYRLGTVGPALPGVELRIAGDGEVLVRGENVFGGYYGDEPATRAVLDEEGWLATGDVGELDADGFLTITDRKKDLVVTAGGKKVSPQNLEAALRASRYVSEALVVGEGRPYLVALLVPDRQELARAGVADERVHAVLEQVVAEANRDRGPVEQVKRFAVVPRELSLEKSELTATLKVRRHVCEDHFREEIEGLYARTA